MDLVQGAAATERGTLTDAERMIMCDDPVDIPPDGDPADVVLADSERQPCEVWSRCMGYHRPVSCWNKGKQAEHAERVFFTEATSARLMSHDRGPC